LDPAAEGIEEIIMKWSPGLFITSHTCKSQAMFDEAFLRIIKGKHPDWFAWKKPSETTRQSKVRMLRMSIGSPKPSRKTLRGARLYRFTKPGRGFDPEFDRLVRERHPDWFNDAEQKKRTLLSMPIGCEKPKSNSSVLGRALRKYTYKNNSSYDPEFDRMIRERQPDWFLTVNQKKKRDMLAMPEGCDKPPKKGIGRFLRVYTAKGGKYYDADFDKAIRDRHPQWFNGERLVSLLSKNANKTKLEILELPKGAIERPKNLYYYMDRDPEFAKLVRERQAQWFRSRRKHA
jgi:hypothetical protein